YAERFRPSPGYHAQSINCATETLRQNLPGSGVVISNLGLLLFALFTAFSLLILFLLIASFLGILWMLII
ncbi:hypothetical protein, partial [Yersinia pestis]|uniref:hypothetical protein n=1 Tax=Yersinia pestis TaxID=632 RepID=UPI000577909F